MSTPSERLWTRRAEWLDAESARPGVGRRSPEPMTLAASAERVAAGVELRAATVDFLDDLRGPWCLCWPGAGGVGQAGGVRSGAPPEPARLGGWWW